MFERFTERARQVIVLAQEEARYRTDGSLRTDHILVGLLLEDEGLAARVLRELGLSLDGVRAYMDPGQVSGSAQRPFTERAKKVLEMALREALSLGHNYIGTEHILLALIRDTDGPAAKILLINDCGPEKIREAVIKALCGPSRKAPQEPPPPSVIRERTVAEKVDLLIAKVATLEGRLDALTRD